jgi:glucose-1-phosphate thymidylyltransferase
MLWLRRRIVKALVLAGGTGSRLRPITHTQSKQLIPVANKPILFYGMEALAEAGIEDIGVIVGDTEEEIREAVGDGSRWDVRVTYIRQEAPLGLFHAVITGRRFLGDDEFVMYLGDNLVVEGITQFVKAYEQNRPDAQIFLVKVPEPERFGVAVLEGDRVIRLVEKPKEHLSGLALAGVYIFNSNVFRAASAIQPSWRGELEITDAIQYLVDRGHRVRAELITGWWKDTGKLEDLLEANRIVLEQLPGRVEGSVDEGSQLVGDVIVEAGSIVEESLIRGPCIIGGKVKIVRSILGPHVSVYDGSTIEDSQVSNSIIMGDCRIHEVRPMSDSLIGEHVRIHKDQTHPSAFQFMLGDSSDIRIP